MYSSSATIDGVDQRKEFFSAMNSSWRIGRISAIPVYFHWTMVVLPLFVFLRGYMLETPAELFLQMMLVFALYACLLFHEAGHVLVASIVKLPFRDITFYPLGGTARLTRLSEYPRQEIWVALAGPAVHGLIAGIIAVFCCIADFPVMPRYVTEPVMETFWNRLLWLNVLLMLLHLLPCFPLDGGRLFRGALALSARRLRATEVAALLSSFSAVVLLICGMIWIDHLWGGMLMLLGVIVHISGQQELMHAYYFASLQHAPPMLPGGSSPIQAPVDQLIEEEAKPAEPNFSGFTWCPRNRLWIEWRNGTPVAANALIGD